MHNESGYNGSGRRDHGAAWDAEDGPDPASLDRLKPHVVNLWGGRYSRRGRFRTEAADVAEIMEGHLPARVRALGRTERLPVVLYAHGGLVAEADGLRIASAQVPWWRHNRVYPIQFLWETGAVETIVRMLGVQRAAAARTVEPEAATRGVLDGAVEGFVRLAGGVPIWGGMKHGAAAAFEPGGDGLDFVARFAGFLKDHGDRVTLHAVGHSAGSIFHAHLVPHLLDALRRTGAEPRVETLSVMAPAITVADYLARLDRFVGHEIGRLAMFTMSERLELADTVTPAYGKSLLYLISRALEPEPDTPILGLEESVRADSVLRRRFGLDGGRGASAEVVWSRTEAVSGRAASQATSHGGFDNDPATMESILRRVRDLHDADPVDKPFPPDRVQRSFPPSLAWPEPPHRPGGTGVSVPPSSQEYPVPKNGNGAFGGARRALCVGIDGYPDPYARLSGCVADARAWERALSDLGFSVRSLHDGEATRDALLRRLGDLLDAARPGDHLVFQFAGHGTQLDDTDADEDDARDEAICPHDYADGRFIVDDDLAEVFRRLGEGVGLTCFFDCCHSGTITRFAVGRASLPGDVRARFLVPTAEMNARHRAFRARHGDGARGFGARGFGASRSTPSQMRQVVFAACSPVEVALETNGRGDFSRRAVPLLARAGAVTNARFQDLVTAEFGASPRQHPNLDCAPGNKAAVFLAGAAAGGSRDAGGVTNGHAAPEDKLVAIAGLLEATARLLR